MAIGLAVALDWLCITDCGISACGLNGLRKHYEHPAYTLVGGVAVIMYCLGYECLFSVMSIFGFN